MNSSVSYVVKKGGANDDEYGYFQLFFNYLEERPYNNIHQNVKQDADYLEAMMLENKLNDQYQQLNLSDEQRKIIMQWTDAIQAQNSAYTALRPFQVLCKLKKLI